MEQASSTELSRKQAANYFIINEVSSTNCIKYNKSDYYGSQ